MRLIPFIVVLMLSPLWAQRVNLAAYGDPPNAADDAAFLAGVQAAPQPAPALQLDALDALDKQIIAHVNQMANLANKACTALDETKAYDSARKLLEAQIASRHPGFRLDPKGVLVPTK